MTLLDGRASLSEPPPYQRELLAFLQQHEPEVWAWFTSNRVRREYTENVRLDLLKSTYRLDRAAHGSLYEAAEHVASRLALEAPITLYQAQGVFAPNASLAYIPREVHIVFHGNAQELLDEAELRAVFGHELGHFLFLENWDGQYMTLGEVLAAMSHDPNASTAHIESARLFGLYTEIFCDRIARDVTDDLKAAVSSFVKLETGLTNVSADSYLRQAEEILSAGPIKTEGLEHPETFIRVRALQLYHEKDDQLDQTIAGLIEGKPTLTRLDFLAQRSIAANTRWLLDRLFAEPWMQSDAALAHARLFFDGYAPPRPADAPETPGDDLQADDAQLRDYYAYVMLDFITADSERTEPALAWALEVAEWCGLHERLGEIASKELKLGKKAMDAVVKRRDELISAARREFAVESEEAE